MSKFDTSIGLDNGKIYFFVGNTCTSCDFREKTIDAGYPKTIDSAFPGVWSNLDAVVRGHGSRLSKLYFFKGSQYLRYDLKDEKVDSGYPKSISRWKGDLWSRGLKASFNSPTDRKLFFFKDDECTRYERGEGPDAGYPLKMSSAFPGVWPDFEDVYMGQGSRAKKAYFFKGDRYTRYDLVKGAVDSGYPRKISSSQKRIFNGLRAPAARTPTANGTLSVTADGDSNYREQIVGRASEKKTPVGYVCTTQRYKVDTSFNENYLLSTHEKELFPGNIISAKSYASGAIAPVIAKRQPYMISSSVSSDTSWATVSTGSLSVARQAISKILPFNQTTPAGIVSESSIVKSEEDLRLSLKASYSNGITNMTGSVNLNQTTKSNVVCIKFLQIYYTVDVDNPSDKKSSAIFADETQIDDDMLIVSQVGYGRHLIFLVETNYSETDIGAAFEATHKVGSVEVKAEYKKMLENSRINVFSIGGSASDTIDLISEGAKGISRYMKAGKDFGKNSPGAPLFYKLSFLNSWKPANVRFSTEISRTECVQTSGKFRFSFDEMKIIGVEDPGSGEEVYGNGWCELYVIPKGETKAKRVRSTTGERSRVFSISRNHAKELAVGGRTSSLGSKVYFEVNAKDYGYESFNELKNANKAYFKVGVDLKEADTFSADDIFPKEPKIVYLKNANLGKEKVGASGSPPSGTRNDPSVIHVENGGSKVDVHFSIVPEAE